MARRNDAVDNLVARIVPEPSGADYIAKALNLTGINWQEQLTEHLQETPDRIFRFWQEFINPNVDLHGILKKGFSDESPHEATGGMVVQTDIPFRGLCAHHFLPFVGVATVGYLPRKRVVGLSKIARLVDAVGTRLPSTQEVITNTVADVMSEALDSSGVIVVTKAAHMCMTARGIKAEGTETVVSAIRGLFVHGAAARAEFFSLAQL